MSQSYLQIKCLFSSSYLCFPADPPRVHEAVTSLSELCDEERCAASRSRCLVGRPSLPEAAHQLHGRCRDPSLLLPLPVATGEITQQHRGLLSSDGSIPKMCQNFQRCNTRVRSWFSCKTESIALCFSLVVLPEN